VVVLIFAIYLFTKLTYCNDLLVLLIIPALFLVYDLLKKLLFSVQLHSCCVVINMQPLICTFQTNYITHQVSK